MWSRFIENAAELLLGARCRVCGNPGLGCCHQCREVLNQRQPHSVTRRGLALPVWATHPYLPALAPLVLGFKENGAWQLAGFLADQLARSIVASGVPSHAVVVPIPSRPRAVRQRGLDHAATLAKLAARRVGMRWDRLLSRRDAPAGQRGLSRSGREQLGPQHFWVRPSTDPVMLIDDVITTGATLIAAQQALTIAGVEVLAAATICDANAVQTS